MWNVTWLLLSWAYSLCYVAALHSLINDNASQSAVHPSVHLRHQAELQYRSDSRGKTGSAQNNFTISHQRTKEITSHIPIAQYSHTSQIPRHIPRRSVYRDRRFLLSNTGPDRVITQYPKFTDEQTRKAKLNWLFHVRPTSKSFVISSSKHNGTTHTKENAPKQPGRKKSLSKGITPTVAISKKPPSTESKATDSNLMSGAHQPHAKSVPKSNRSTHRKSKSEPPSTFSSKVTIHKRTSLSHSSVRIHKRITKIRNHTTHNSTVSAKRVSKLNRTAQQRHTQKPSVQSTPKPNTKTHITKPNNSTPKPTAKPATKRIIKNNSPTPKQRSPAKPSSKANGNVHNTPTRKFVKHMPKVINTNGVKTTPKPSRKSLPKPSGSTHSKNTPKPTSKSSPKRNTTTLPKLTPKSPVKQNTKNNTLTSVKSNTKPPSKPPANSNETSKISPNVPPTLPSKNSEKPNNSSSRSEEACRTFQQNKARQVLLEDRINGGVVAKQREFPYMVAIGFVNGSTSSNSSNKSWSCGGSLISERYVLTAAHCITNEKALNRRPATLRVGVHRLQREARLPDDMGVEAVALHPLHRPPSRYHDLALLRTDRPATLAGGQPVCLGPGAARGAAARLAAAGWGATDASGFKLSEELRKADLQIVSLEICKRFYNNPNTLPKGLNDSMLCARNPKREASVCMGDSGGPLVVREAGEDFLVGVISFGARLCGGSTPAVFASISPALRWIESVVWPGSTKP